MFFPVANCKCGALSTISSHFVKAVIDSRTSTLSYSHSFSHRSRTMTVISSIFKCGAVSIALAAVFIGLLFTGTLRLNTLMPSLLEDGKRYGSMPVFVAGVEWGYTWKDLEKVDLKGQTARAPMLE
jgi:hypothetical protein